MNERPICTEEKRSPGKLVLPSLVISNFAAQLPALLVGLLLIDIAQTFGQPVGIAGQIRTLAMSLGVIFAMLMGVLSVRFKHKSLLVVGLLLYSLAALGCGFAPNFSFMLVAYSMAGVAAAMVSPMSLTLVGEHFTQEKRGGAIGWIAAAALSYVIGSPVIGAIADFGGWRTAFLAYVLPVILLGLLLAAKSIPSAPHGRESTISLKDYSEGFKGVFSNRSADACLAGSALSGAAWMAILIYGPSFFRQRFLMSTGFVSIIVLVAALCYTFGSLVSGRYDKKVGRKLMTVLGAFSAGIFTISYASLSDLGLSLAVFFLGCLFAGMRYVASTGLTVEQVPRFRGTMMSINHASIALGDALGSGIGGLALLLSGYGGMAICLGSMGIAAATVFQFLAIDPTRTEARGHS